MKKLLLSTAVAVGAPDCRQASGAQDEVRLRAGAEEHEQPVLRPGPRRLQEGRSRIERRLRMHVYRPRRAWRRRRAGADRAGPGGQEGRRHRRVARQRRGHGGRAAGGQGRRHPGADLGLATCCPRTRICASPISARTTTRSAPTSPSSPRRSSRRAARSASSRAARRRPTTTSACRASATRSPGKESAASPGDVLTGQNGWTEARRLPALHRRRLPALGAAVRGHHGEEPEPRRLHPDRRLPAVHPRRQPRRGGASTRTRSRRRRWRSSSPTRCRSRSTR